MKRFLLNHFTKTKKSETSIKLIVEIKSNENQPNKQTNKITKCLIYIKCNCMANGRYERMQMQMHIKSNER